MMITIGGISVINDGDRWTEGKAGLIGGRAVRVR